MDFPSSDYDYEDRWKNSKNFIGSVPAFIVSVKVYKDTEIAGLSDQKKQEQVNVHIFVDQFSEHDNNSQRYEQYLQGQVALAFPVV